MWLELDVMNCCVDVIGDGYDVVLCVCLMLDDFNFVVCSFGVSD